MTRKHFIHLARVLKHMKPSDQDGYNQDEYMAWDRWKGGCDEIATLCYSHNSQFDKRKFLIACGVDDELY
jgi:hypothetical protein